MILIPTAGKVGSEAARLLAQRDEPARFWSQSREGHRAARAALSITFSSCSGTAGLTSTTDLIPCMAASTDAESSRSPLTTSTPSCLASSDARRLGAAGPGTLASDAVMTTTLRDSPVTLVTGANKRIGLETVRRLVDAGYRVYVGARAERGRAAAEAAGAEFVQLDVTSDDSVRRAADILERAGGAS